MSDRYFVTWSSAQWRVPLALQIILELILITCIGFVSLALRLR